MRSRIKKQLTRRARILRIEHLEDRRVLSGQSGAEPNEILFSEPGLIDRAISAAYSFDQFADEAGSVSPLSATPQAITAPATPTGLTAQPTGPTSILIDWNDSPGADTYHLLRSTSPSGPFDIEQRIYWGPDSIYTDSGNHLIPGTTYYYALRASNTGGDSPQSAVVSAITFADDHGNTPETATPVVPPQTITGTLNWDADEDWFTSVYQVGDTPRLKTTLGTLTSGMWALYDEDGDLGPSGPLGGPPFQSTVQPGQAGRYYLKIFSPNGDTGTYTSEVTLIQPPAAPLGVTADPRGPDWIRVRWSVSISAGDYFVERALTESGPYTQIAIVPAEKTFYDDNLGALAPDTPYYYRIRANTDGLFSAYSPVATARTLPELGGFDSGPRVTSPANLGTRAPGVSFVDVVFNELIDPTSFAAADDVTLRRGTTAIGVQQPFRPDAINQPLLWRIPFASQTAPGIYILRVGPYITDLAGNEMNQDGDTTNGEGIADRFMGWFRVLADTSPPAVTFLSPNTGSFQVGDTIEIQGIANDSSGISHVWIELYKGGEAAANRVGYVYQGAPGSGSISSHSWTIPATIGTHTIDGSDYKIKWVAFDASPNNNGGGDHSDSFLSIAPAPVQPGLVTGAIYNDADGDGHFNESAGGFANLRVQLQGLDSTGSEVIRELHTDPDGFFAFYEVPPSGPGGYTLSVQPPGTIRQTEPTSGPPLIQFTLSPGSAVRRNFGFVAPLYVIVHGFQSSEVLPPWANDMATAISFRTGLSSDNLIVFDWATTSNNVSGTGWPEAAGSDLAGIIVHSLKTSVGHRDVHFIAHSRGSVVISQAIARLAPFTTGWASEPGLELIRHIQMTTLDPRPVHEFGADDPDVTVWSHVLWADNYYQQSNEPTLPEGRPVPGALNINLTSVVNEWRTGLGGVLDGDNHSEVHEWYHWTVDTDGIPGHPQYQDADLSSREFALPRTDLYSHLSSDVGTISGAGGDVVGFYWDATSAGATDRPDPVYARLDAPPADTLFNGDFTLNDSESSALGQEITPGWESNTFQDNWSRAGVALIRQRSDGVTTYLRSNHSYVPGDSFSVSMDVAIQGGMIARDANTLYVRFVPADSGTPIDIGEVKLRELTRNQTHYEFTLPSTFRTALQANDGLVGKLAIEVPGRGVATAELVLMIDNIAINRPSSAIPSASPWTLSMAAERASPQSFAYRTILGVHTIEEVISTYEPHGIASPPEPGVESRDIELNAIPQASNGRLFSRDHDQESLSGMLDDEDGSILSRESYEERGVALDYRLARLIRR